MTPPEPEPADRRAPSLGPPEPYEPLAPIPRIPEHFRLYRFLCHPALYIALLLLWVAVDTFRLLPFPEKLDLSPGPPPRAPRRSLLADPFGVGDAQQRGGGRGLSLRVAVLVFCPLLVGLAVLVRFVALRALKVRLFPPNAFRVPDWSGWHLLRVGVLFVVFHRLALAGIAWLNQLQATGHWTRKIPDVVIGPLATSAMLAATCLFLVLLLAAGRQRPFRALGLRERRPVARAVTGVTGLLAGFPLIVLAWLLMSLVWRILGWAPEQQPVLEAARTLSRKAFLVLVFSGVVLAPLTEEILFRGFLYATLRTHLGPRAAIAVSAAAFAALHGFAFGFLQLFIIGVLLAYLYEKTGSLAASIVAHAANNFYSFLVVYLVFRWRGF